MKIATAVLLVALGTAQVRHAQGVTLQQTSQQTSQQTPEQAEAARLRERLIFVQVPVLDDPGAGRGRPDHHPDEAADIARPTSLPTGSRIVSFDPANPAGGVVNLTPGFAAAGRPDLSFDARRILFIGRQAPNDSFHVWEMNADGTGVRRITRQSVPVTADSTAIYLSTIYTIDAEAPVYQIAFSGSAGRGDSQTGKTDSPPVGAGSCSPPRGWDTRAIYTCHMDGTQLRQITFNPEGAFDPYMLRDGRLLFSSWGAAAQSLRGATERGKSARVEDRGSVLLTVNPDGTDVFAFAAAHERPAVRSMPCETPNGWVVYVESEIGNEDRGGLLAAVASARSLHTRRVIASDPAGLYYSPSPLPDGNLLVSYRPNTEGSYGVYLLDTRSGTRIARVYDSAEWHEIDAIALHPRSEPAGRSSVVDEGIASGLLYCLNVYLSDTEDSKRIGEGRIRRIQVFIGAALLGEAPVEPDGSFFLEVPARTPLRLQTIGADGEILQAMRSSIWVMPKEARGCIGCHEDRELAPPNRFVSALRKPPHRVGLPGDGRRGPTMWPPGGTGR